MPTRPNPYQSSANTYGSSGLAPRFTPRGDSIALPLAQMVGQILDVATYDQNTDPRATGAALDRAKLGEIERKRAAAGFLADSLNNSEISLSDFASGYVGRGGDLKDVGTVGIARNALDPKNTSYLGPELDRFAVLRGDTPNQTLSASTYGERNKPTPVIGADGVATYAPASETTGQRPVLSKEQVAGTILSDLAANLSRPEKLAAVGAEPKVLEPFNYVGPNGQGSTMNPGSVAGPNVSIYRGSVQGGNPGDLTTGVKSQVQGSNLALQNFKGLVGMARSIASQDPTLFGVTGEARRVLQEGSQQLQNLKLMTGSQSSSLDGIYQETLAKMAANGIQVPGGGTYDPNLSDIRKLSILMRYAGAAALAGQQGRSVSNEDVKTFTNVVGDPTSFLSSQQQYISGLDLMDKIAAQMEGNNNSALGKPAAPPAAAPAVAPKAPAEMSDEELLQHLKSRQ